MLQEMTHDDLSKMARTRRMILSRVVLTPFVTVLLVVITLVYWFASTLKSQVVNQQVQLVEMHRSAIEQFLSERLGDLRFVSTLHDFRFLSDSQHLESVFERLQAQSPAFMDIGVFDDAGHHLAYVGPYDTLVGKDYSATEWFQEVSKRDQWISDVFLGYRNIPHFIIAVKRIEGDRVWYVRATIDSVYFDKLVEGIAIGKTGEAYIINNDGVFQTRRRSSGSLMNKDQDFIYYHPIAEGVISYSAEDHRGDQYLYTVGRLHQKDWQLIVRQEVIEAYSPLIGAVVFAVIIIVIGGIVVITMAFLLSSSLAQRLMLAVVEKRRMGSQLIMAGKLAEVGEMSAGIAHEINNPLQVMKSEYTMINDILKDCPYNNYQLNPEDFRLLNDSVEQISFQINRCKDITQGLLKFARKSDPSNEPINVAVFIRGIVAMVEKRARLENISIVQNYAEDLPQITSSPNHLQQVFLNLLNNAFYALRGRADSQVVLSARRVDSAVEITVADNGCGIPGDALEKVFMPFYTTKPVGQGTGLGLSTCLGIVERLGGTLGIDSELNVGTVLSVRLPIQNAERTS